ncbi:MAG: hypothetical protein LBF71_04780 [Campylobacteraceae bacterium]|nr:hypothetical protein [Campylobacteraceae bacterium]
MDCHAPARNDGEGQIAMQTSFTDCYGSQCRIRPKTDKTIRFKRIKQVNAFKILHVIHGGAKIDLTLTV